MSRANPYADLAMNDDQLRTALQAEYLHLQQAVEDMDARAVTIKAWSISFSLAAVAVLALLLYCLEWFGVMRL